MELYTHLQEDFYDQRIVIRAKTKLKDLIVTKVLPGLVVVNEKSYCVSVKIVCQQYQQFGDGCNEFNTHTAPQKSHTMLMVTRELEGIHRGVFIEARAMLSSMPSDFQGSTRYVVH
jgi:hypothetical protein